MTENLKKRVVSQRGASLSFALFVLLVCMVVSAAVLAAATTASGQYVELGKYDRRYYSVVSAANLFRGELTAGNSVTYTVVETREGSVIATRTDDSDDEVMPETLPETDEYAIQFKSITPNGSDFDFIKDITLYGLYGSVAEPSGFIHVGSDDNFISSWSQLTPFAFTSQSPHYIENKYTISPQMSDDIDTTVTVRIHNNWLVEVLTTSDDEKFTLYMAFQGTCEQGVPSIATTMGNADATGGIEVTVEESRTTTVTWKLVRIMPGRGFADV